MLLTTHPHFFPFVAISFAGEIVEGSKDGDFLADLDGPPEQAQSTADDKGSDGGAIKREEDGGEGQEDVVGEKRVKSETVEEGGIKADVGGKYVISV